MRPAKESALHARPADTPSGFWIHKIVGGNGWRFHEHSHRGYGELVCATKGEFRHVINGREGVQRAGEVVFIRETDSHTLSGRHFAYVNVMFDPGWLVRLERYAELPGAAESLTNAGIAPCAVVPAGEREAFERTLDQLLATSASLQGRRVFAGFLLTVVTQYLAPLQDRDWSAEVPPWLRELLAWLAEHRDEHPSLEDLVRHSCRCHEHVTREFSRHLGVTPSRYLSDLKIDRAAEMLVTTNHKMLEICHASGFENESYFFRLFRQRKGSSPRTYRQSFGGHGIQR